MALVEYKKKRRFNKTPEPGPERKDSGSGRLFVIQKHRASHLHYDFRLESQGVLKSWAVPKGPSLDPSVKRLAMQVEDHPVDYADFEGIIPEGEYGGGTVMVWDHGTYAPENGESISSAIHKGELKFTLKGKKLKGSWALVRTRDRQWLLIKHKDQAATKEDVAEAKPLSVITGRSLAEIAKDEGGNVDKATTGDPEKLKKKRRTSRRGASRSPSVWRSNRSTGAKASKSRAKEVAMPEGAKKAAMPSSVKPMLAMLVDKPFTDEQWLFETKWDGVRAVCFLKNGKMRLVSRNQREMTAQYPELSEIGNHIDAETAILDGEIVALDKQGIPRFQLLQPRFGRKKETAATEEFTIAFYVFDMLYRDGYDLTPCKLLERKAILEKTLRTNQELRYSDHVLTRGEKFFEQIEKMRLEGMIAKRVDSTYVHRRSNDWLKVKTIQRQEVVIGGYTKPRGSRTHLGALVVGLYDGKELRYVGHTGGGFNRKTLAEMHKQLQPLKTTKSPFSREPKTNEPVQWVKPKLVCEVKFSEWTNDGNMRHPIYLGLRDDKSPAECRVEKKHDVEVEVAKAERKSSGRVGRKNEKAIAFSDLGKTPKGDIKVRIGRSVVQLTNLDKIYWPGDGYTKADLIRYYAEIGKAILPYYKDRPLILKRYPNGIKAEPFHQHSLENPPEFVKTYVREKENGESVVYGIANNVETLVYFANLGSISLHPWASRAQSPEKPDWIIFDVDPGAATFDTVCDVALEVKNVLDDIGLVALPKTSGSKGLHVYVPVRADYKYEQVVPFANLVSAVVASNRPDLVSIERMVAKRKKGRVYLDFLQNGFGKSVAGPYSVRAREGATVSTPLEWDEVKRKKFKPQDFTIKTIFKRMDAKGDLFEGFFKHRQSITKAVGKLSEMMDEE
jgi:bifunctional non-homologous end joining protein LigD